MLRVLILPERSGGSVQRRYITSGNFDLCIDDGKRVALLTSDSSVWQNIESGTRIVMRVIFERPVSLSATYECRLCGAQNELGSLSSFSGWLTDGSLDWFVLCIGLIRVYLTRKSHGCKGRFQISLDPDQKNQGEKYCIDTEIRHCIRNFRVTRTVCMS